MLSGENGFKNTGKHKMYWGYHLLLDCGECNITAITSEDTIKKFIADLVSSIDMVAIGEPWIARTAIGQPDKEGFSVYQLIVTSNISAHIVDESRQIYLDVFSCKPYDIDTVKEIVQKWFGPKSIKQNYIKRNAD